MPRKAPTKQSKIILAAARERQAEIESALPEYNEELNATINNDEEDEEEKDSESPLLDEIYFDAGNEGIITITKSTGPEFDEL